MAPALAHRFPPALAAKYDRILQQLLKELGEFEVDPVRLTPLGVWERYNVQGVPRVPWVGRERRALSRAMANFPPAVRTVMAQVLRPLESLTLVDVQDGGGVAGVGEGVELAVLITRWRAAARAGRAHLRSTWFPTSLAAIREATLATNLSPARRLTVIHAFNNLLASKLQEVLIRSVEGVLAWLGSEEEPWQGPRVRLYLVLDDNQVVLSPDQEDIIDAFTDLFKELDECVQLYRGTWDDPQPPKVPRWRLRMAENDGSPGDGGNPVPPLRPLEPRRETLVVSLSEPQWAAFHDALAATVHHRFGSASTFLHQISEEWSAVLSGGVRSEVEEFLRQDAQLEEYAGKVLHFSSYVEQASHVPTSTLLHVFRLEYQFLRQSLLSVSSSFVLVLRDRLVADHRKTIKGLNQDFETIHKRIQETPKSTEQLFKLMEYVEEVRRITIHRLAEEVAAMVSKLKIILDVVHLTPDDLTTTALVIVWPAKLKPVVDRAVESLEDFKQEFEERLVERAGEVSHTLNRIQDLVTELEELSQVAHVNKYIREVKKLEGRLEKVSSLVTWVNQEEALFKFQVSSFPLLMELKDCLVPYEELFTLVMKWRKYEKYWMDGDFTTLDPEFIDVETEELTRELLRLRKAFKTKFKQQALEGDPRKARMNLDDPNPNNLPGPLRVCALALAQIKDFKQHLPLVSVLCNKGLRPRHWHSLNKAAGFDITPNAGTSLRKVVQMKLGGLLKEFEVVSSGASREYSLERSLATMREIWSTTTLAMAPHPEVAVEVVVGLEEVRELVEDHLITTHTIKNSPFVAPFKQEVKEWEATLRTVQRSLAVWLKVQTLWVDLTPLFFTPDLPLQLPDEHRLFLELDRKWTDVAAEAVAVEQLLDLAGDTRKLEDVSGCLQHLAVLQKAVHVYLDNKRRVFPRLFFLSNEELTALLCERDPSALEQHLRKCFDGVFSLHLDLENNVEAVGSKEGEVVPLANKLATTHASSSIENWLLQFQETLTYTLKMKVGEGADTWGRRGGGTGNDLDALLPPWPLQVILTLRHVFWTAEVHQAICGGTLALQECLARLQGEVERCVSLVQQTSLEAALSPPASGPLSPSPPVSPRASIPPSASPVPSPSPASPSSTPIPGSSPPHPPLASTPVPTAVVSAAALRSAPRRHALSTLILGAVYARDVLQEMVEQEVTSEESFTWLAQLRLYLREAEVEAQLLHCGLPWGWEYVGARGKLVVTPLTSRAHHALASAFHAHLGGAPEGPAGTGKTETVKDLARSLAINCLVFNCSDDLDYISMGQFFSGIAASGSWACFDEFNRLEVGVLSVAAQQILTLVTARRECRDTFVLDGGKPLSLDPRGFLAVTMNPNYPGRVPLPDNLKMLLRPVSMMVADYQSIAEVSLLAGGFLHARPLATRLVGVMEQASQMLEPHNHYDFGMRAVKTVLLVAERLRMTFPAWSETEVVVRALRQVNHPKLVAHDTRTFEDILCDFFLELPPTPRAPLDTLTSCIEKVCEAEGLQLNDEFLQKMVQLYETLKERHGVMVVGPPTSAKTTTIKTLAKALSLLDPERPVTLEVINPKTVTPAQLIGSLDPASREWSDGLLTKALRRGKRERCWLVLDGPADASWVEDLNTALDDSRKLCLPSGETLPLPTQMAVIFEVLDLSQASLASVSRCGVVFVGSNTLSWPALLHSWLHAHSEDAWWKEHTPLLKDLATWILPPTLDFALRQCSYLLPPSEISLVRSLFPLMDTIVQDAMQDAAVSQKDSAKLGPTWTTAAFLSAVTWSLGGGLTAASKDTFSDFFRRLAMGYNPDFPAPASVGQIGCPYPVECTVFDLMFDAKQRSFWRPWTEVIKHAECPETTNISTILVPTVESARLEYLLDVCGRAVGGVLVVGEGESGRKVTMQHYLKGLPTASVDTVTFPVTPAATALPLKSQVMKRLEVRPSGAWGARGGRRLVVLVEDLHLAAEDQHRARPLHEAVREALQQNTWVEEQGTGRRALEGITWFGGVSLKAGGQLEPRCQASHMVVTAHSLPQATLNRIFTTQLNIFLRSGGFVPDMFTVVAGIVEGTMTVLRHTQASTAASTIASSHHVFNLSTAARVIHSVSFLRKEAMETKRHFVRLWVHETYREFCDQLTEESEVGPIFTILVNTIRSSFRDKIHVIFDKLCNEDGSVTEACLERACWGVIGATVDTPIAERRYEEVTDLGQLQHTITAFTQHYNTCHSSPLNLVTFKHMVGQVARISRVLGRAGGHLLLVGAGGSGRRSLTRLAAHICGHTLLLPAITPHDDYSEVREAVKEAVMRAGVDEQATVVVVGDAALHHPSVLHLVNTLILTGDAPNILSPEDRSYLRERLRLFLEGREVTESEVWEEQERRVKELVHIVVTCLPSPNLHHTLTHYPAFTTRVTINFFKRWPEKALVRVGEHYLEEVSLRRSMRDTVISAATLIHQLAREESERVQEKGGWCPPVTPSSYLHLLQEFRGLFTSRQATTSAFRKKYLSGLDKLAFAASQISVMQEMLASLGPQIEEAAEGVSNMMQLIEQESMEVEARRKLVAIEEEEAGVHTARARQLQEECQAELNQALPALHEAVAALNTLKPADITVVKSMKNPPQAIKLVMAAVCVMLEIKPDKLKNSTAKATMDYWGPSKKLLGDLSFLQQLRDYDKDNIPDTLMEKVNKEYVRLPEFEPALVAKASSAAEGLCKWVRAMSAYHAIAKVVAPKRERLAEAEAEVAAMVSLLEAKRGQLRELEEKLEVLQRRFSLSCREKENLEAEQRLCALKLQRARKLISGLGGEQTRWEAAAETAGADLLRLPGDTLLAAASLAYLPPHLPEVRDELVGRWCAGVREAGLEVSEGFSLVGTLTPALHTRAWGLEGLPTDSFSLQNATIIKHTNKWPLLVDPDEVGSRWIQQHEAANGLEVVWQQDFNKLARAGSVRVSLLEEAVTRCVTRGHPLLLLDLCGDPPPLLTNVLTRTITEEGGVKVVAVGSLTLQYNNNFRLYLSTRHPRPPISLEVAGALTVVNFTVTVHGLHDHLRQILVSKERPELEDERQKLVVTMSSYQRALQATEERILHTLSSVQGNILESEEAILILQQTKQMSNEIKRKQEQCAETEAALLECCRQYEAVSRPAAALYMTLASLTALSHMYQYSLSWYITLYIFIIDNTGKSSVLERRLGLLREALVGGVQRAVVRGLATPHHLPFTLLVAFHTLRGEGGVSIQEEAALYHLVAQSTSTAPAHPVWLPPPLLHAWPALHYLMTLPVFHDLEESLREQSEAWVRLVESQGLPEKSVFPRPWHLLPPLPWLLLVSALRKDKVTWAVKTTVAEVMGSQYVVPPPLALGELLQLPAPTKGPAPPPPPTRHPPPLLLVTSAGVDPLEEVRVLGMPFTSVSLGQGQSRVAEEAVRVGVEEGGWVVLQNLHHALDWLPSLANTISRLYNPPSTPSASTTSGTTTAAAPTHTRPAAASAAAATTLHPSFRLILTTEPTPKFPASLLRVVEKVWVDCPADPCHALHQNFQTLFRHAAHIHFTDEEEEEEAATWGLLHGLAVFHTVVSERGRHGHLAWTNPPAFTSADLVLTVNIVTSSIDEGQELDLESLEYLVGRVIYGGRVLRTEDQRVISSILREVLSLSLGRPALEEPPQPVPGEELECRGLAGLFPEVLGKVEDVQDFLVTVTGLEDPEIFGLPAGVQRLQEEESGHALLTALATAGGAQDPAGSVESSLAKELMKVKKMLPEPVAGAERLQRGEDEDLVLVVRREAEHHNTALATITTTLQAAIHTTAAGGGDTSGVAAAVGVGRTPPCWLKLYSTPAPPLLNHFLQQLHARTSFLQSMVEGGAQRHFPLAVFQFLPAFLTTALRRAARAAYQPLHYLTWSFHLTDLPPEPLPDLPADPSPDPSSEPPVESPDVPADPPPPSESPANQSEPSNPPVDPPCDPTSTPPCENPTESPTVDSTQLSDPPTDRTPATPTPQSNASQDSPSQGTVDEELEGEKAEEEGLQEDKEEEEEHVWACWGQDGNTRLLASGLWLVGASWNAERYELEEASLQGLVEPLPLLSMVPLVTQGSTPPQDHIQEEVPVDSDGLASPGDGLASPGDGLASPGDGLASPGDGLASPGNGLASPGDGSGSLVRSSLESGCPSLDIQLEEAEDIEAARGEEEGDAGQYLCPLYQGGPSSTPGPPVLMVSLPSGPQGADYWVQRRVAIYLSQH
ncbi:dynein axonemal heavy chain 7-like [Eriocheir sinensis]|uniref:dynein axonemal heavy chain 7-like n=1 Tax=Eriocheir sinensis TaxID=95602 RepID=UPI0021C85E68|nr:dynein axonemal heavy chain 7-like [Eriocheir sinensis]